MSKQVGEQYLQFCANAILECLEMNQSLLDPIREGWFRKGYGSNWAENAVLECQNILEKVNEKAWREIKNKCSTEYKHIVQEIEEKERILYDRRSAYHNHQVNMKQVEGDLQKIDPAIQSQQEKLQLLDSKYDQITEIYIRHYNRKFRELMKRMEQTDDPDLQKALFLVASAITYNMKGTIQNYEKSAT